MKEYLNYTKHKGTNTSVATNKLIDSTADFLGHYGSPQVFPGDVVECESTNPVTRARVVAVESSSTLVLDAHIFNATGLRYRVRAGFAYASGTTTSRVQGKLVDTNANFQTCGIRPGHVVRIGSEYAHVELVESPTTLVLSRDIATSAGLTYEVYPGEWVYKETLEEYQKGTLRVLAADSTEITLSSPGPAKTFPFFAYPGYALDVRQLLVVLEAKVSGGSGALQLRVDGNTVASIAVNSTTYSIYATKADLDLSLGKHFVELYAIPPSGGSLTIGLTEFHACETR